MDVDKPEKSTRLNANATVAKSIVGNYSASGSCSVDITSDSPSFTVGSSFVYSPML